MTRAYVFGLAAMSLFGLFVSVLILLKLVGVVASFDCGGGWYGGLMPFWAWAG